MRILKKLFVVAFLLNVFFASAQDVSFKKGIVTIDGKECLKYESDANNVSFQNLSGDDLFMLKYIRVDGVLYTKVVFVETSQSLSSQSYIFSKKNLVEKLLKGNALENCALNDDKVRTFIMKYDEKAEERLNNTNTNTVIIKENDPGTRTGINVNIGR